MVKKDEAKNDIGETWAMPESISKDFRVNYVAIVVLDEIVCRDCMKMVEEISARRGFHDTLSYEEIAEKGAICTRCNKQIKEK